MPSLNAKHDENDRPTMIGVSNVDGLTIIPLQAEPIGHGLEVSDAATGTDNGNNDGIAMIDENGVSVLTALSDANDGTVIELYIDSVTKKLLIKSS